MADNTDRELLDLAAKAAGLNLEFIETLSSDFRTRQELPYLRKDGPRNNRLTDCEVWNPLEDDGDALRLAAKLGITIEFDSPWFEPEETGVNARAGTVHALEFIKSAADLEPAVRRAIVRAAAGIADAGSQEEPAA